MFAQIYIEGTQIKYVLGRFFVVFEKYIENTSLDLSHQLCPCNPVLFDIAKRCSSISLNKCRLRSSTSWPAAPPSDSYVSCPTVPRMSLSRRMSSSAPKGHQSWSHFDFVSFSLIKNSFSRFNRHSRRVHKYTYRLSMYALKSPFFIGKL